MKQLKSCKTGGPDRLLNEFFKQRTGILPKYLYKFFNTLLYKGYFPSSRTQGYIVPIDKKGSLSNVENYRVLYYNIALVNNLLALLIIGLLHGPRNIMHTLMHRLDSGQKWERLIIQYFNLHNIITHLINKGKKLYCVFVDFTKAFDFINGAIL